MGHDIFLLLLLFVNFAPCLHGQANDKFETAQVDRNIRESVTKSQNTIDEERLKWGNLVRFKRSPKVDKVFEKTPSFAKALNKDPELTRKVMRDPAVSKLKETLSRNPSMLTQPNVKKQIRGIAAKNIDRGGGLSVRDKFVRLYDIVMIVLVSVAIAAIPIGGGIAIAKTLSGDR